MTKISIHKRCINCGTTTITDVDSVLYAKWYRKEISDKEAFPFLEQYKIELLKREVCELCFDGVIEEDPTEILQIL